MVPSPKSILLIAVASGVLLAGCAFTRAPRDQVPTLRVEQGSFRMSVGVDADGFAYLAEQAPLMGRIEVSPIIEAEGLNVETVQVVLHQGRFYLTAEGFRNLWELVPQGNTSRATYRPLSVSKEPLSGVRLSRYGPPGRACVRLEVQSGGPWYVTNKGKLHDQCQ